jgi:hypothetical protein
LGHRQKAKVGVVGCHVRLYDESGHVRDFDGIEKDQQPDQGPESGDQ